MISSKIILKELEEYLNSSQIARVYNYNKKGEHFNSKHLDCKIIKENCLFVKKWLLENNAIYTKNLSLFVEGRRSLVPFHYMYKTKYNSSIFNEDCIFDKKYFLQTLKSFRTNKSYSCAFILMKPGAEMYVPNAYCQPYVTCELIHLTGKCFIRTDYYADSVNSQKPVHRFYYRSNIYLKNESKEENAFMFVNCNFMFNKYDLSDAWSSNYEFIQ